MEEHAVVGGGRRRRTKPTLITKQGRGPKKDRKTLHCSKDSVQIVPWVSYTDALPNYAISRPMWLDQSSNFKEIYSNDGEIRSIHVFLKTVYGAITREKFKQGTNPRPLDRQCPLGPLPSLRTLRRFSSYRWGKSSYSVRKPQTERADRCTF